MSKKTLIILFIVLIICVLVLFFFQAKAQPATTAKGTSTSPGVTKIPGDGSTFSSTDSTSPVWPLQNGSQGVAVKLLQILSGVDPDGIWGPDTDTAVQSTLGKNIISQSDFINACIIPAATASDFPLAVGSTGNYVSALQAVYGLDIDGTFGSDTDAALKQDEINGQIPGTDFQHIVANTLNIPGY